MPFTVNVLLACILNCDAGPGAAVIRIVCKYSTVKPRFNEPRYNEDPVITNNI